MFSNYCGPGGSGYPQHETDRACQEHDKNYNFKKYFYYNDADERFLKRLRNIKTQSNREHFINKLASGYFSGKKYMSSLRGFITPRKIDYNRDSSLAEMKSNSNKRTRVDKGYVTNTVLRNEVSLDRTQLNNSSIHKTKSMKSIREHGRIAKPKLSFKTLIDDKYKPYSVTVHSYGCANGPVPIVLGSDLKYCGIPVCCFTNQGENISEMLLNPIKSLKYLKFHGTSGRYLLWDSATSNYLYRFSDPLYLNDRVVWQPSNSTCALERKLSWGRDMIPTFSFVHGATYDPVFTSRISPDPLINPQLGAAQNYGPPPRFCTGLTLYELMKKAFDNFNFGHANGSLYKHYTDWEAVFNKFITVDKQQQKTTLTYGGGYSGVVGSGPFVSEDEFADGSFFKTCTFYYNGGYTEHSFINNNNFAVTLLVAECVPRENIYESIGTYEYLNPNVPVGPTSASVGPENNNAVLYPCRMDPMLPQEMAVCDRHIQLLNRNEFLPTNTLLGDSMISDNLLAPLQRGLSGFSAATLGDQQTFLESTAYTNTWKPYSSSYEMQNRNYSVTKRYVKIEPGDTFKYKVHHNPFKLSSDEWHKLEPTYTTISGNSNSAILQSTVLSNQFMNHPILQRFFSKVLEVTVLAQKGATNFSQSTAPNANQSYLPAINGNQGISSIDRMPGMLNHSQVEHHNCCFNLKQPKTGTMVVNKLCDVNDWQAAGYGAETIFINPEDNKVQDADITIAGDL